MFFFLGAGCLVPVLSFQGLSLGLSVSDIILVNGLATCLSLPSSPITGKSHQIRVFPKRQLSKSVLAAALGPLAHPSRSARFLEDAFGKVPNRKDLPILNKRL